MEKDIGKLIIVRHPESEWNKLGLWTGKTEVHLSEHGFKMAREMGFAIKGLKIDRVFCSNQIRAKETLDEILKVLELSGKIPEERSSALNERDYGDYTGKNKWEIEKIVGEEKFNDIRRGWDSLVPNGETLKMVYARSIPYYLESVLPRLLEGENVLISAHGNSIRTLMKYIERIPDEKMKETEMPFNTILIYQIDKEGCSLGKEIKEVK